MLTTEIEELLEGDTLRIKQYEFEIRWRQSTYIVGERLVESLMSDGFLKLFDTVSKPCRPQTIVDITPVMDEAIGHQSNIARRSTRQKNEITCESVASDLTVLKVVVLESCAVAGPFETPVGRLARPGVHRSTT